jgi:cytochrome c peroxidase
MKILKMSVLSAIALTLVFSFAFASGGVEKGKALFNDPKFSGGTKSCSECHPNGKGLEKAGEKGRTEWKNPAGTWLTLEDASNVCLIMANKGKAIDPRGEDMKFIIDYIKSLSKKKL